MNDAFKLGMMSVLRSILIAGGSWAVTKGYLTDGGLQQVVGAILVVVTAAWGYVDKKEPK